MECICKADLPYPEPEITEKSLYEVKLLMPAYAGRESETTAIFSYIYGHYVTIGLKGELSDCLEKIAISEMRHHDILGKAIVQLGGTPYIGGNYSYWQGGYVNYVKDPVAILKNAIASEKQAIHDYETIAARTRMKEIKILIERIILDERVHVATLTKLLEYYSSSSSSTLS